ncbi:LysR family transcriptional regulator [Ramlibacter sp. MAHUQ-53]|uniref:LysR family transcriptional regulator n=1 Tax=unclassified Ramlibacter TaxID=2617605 RepID=UPI0036324ED0
MQLYQLRALVAVADAGSVSAAARSLGVSQPAVTRALKQLEIDVRATLLYRHSAGVALTDYGTALLAHARLIVKAADKADQHISQMVDARGGTLSVASSATPFMLVLPSALELVRRQFPGLDVRLQEAVYPTVLGLFRDGSIDFAIGPVPAEGLGAEFTCQPLFEVALTVVLRRGHPLARRKSLQALTDLQWILSGPKNGPGAIHDRAFRDAGLEPPVCRTHCESVAAAVHFVAHSDAASFVPRPIAEAFEQSRLVTLVDIAEPTPPMRISLVQPSQSILTPAGQALYSAIRTVSRSLPGAKPL